MSWKDRLLPASFREIPFFVPRTTVSGGRRIVTHEFPLKDSAEHDDLGRQVRRIRFEAIVVGEDYDLTAQRLEIALERSGVGLLVHPHFGRLRVVVKDFDRRESLEREARMARFSVQVQQVERAPVRDQEPDIPRQIEDVATELDDATSADFIERVSVSGPEALRSSISTMISKATSLLAGLDVFSGLARDVGALQDELTGLISQAASLATAPATLAARMIKMVRFVEKSAGNSLKALFAYESLLDLLPTLGLGGAALAKQANENATATTDLVRYTAAHGAVKAAADVSWPSFEDATEARERLLAKFEVLLLTATDRPYQQLMNLMQLAVRSVPPADEDLPRIQTFRPTTSLPAVVLAYRLYEDIARAQEIVDRNDIRHPGFVPPEDLEVRSA